MQLYDIFVAAGDGQTIRFVMRTSLQMAEDVLNLLPGVKEGIEFQTGDGNIVQIDSDQSRGWDGYYGESVWIDRARGPLGAVI